MSGSFPPATAHVRSLEGGPYFTRNEVCRAMGISRSFLERRIEMDGIVQPKVTLMGSMTISLYTNEDLKVIKQFLDERKRVYKNMGKVGRPRLYTPEQRAERQKIQMRISYYKQEGDKAVSAGNHTRAQHYTDRANQASQQLQAIEAEARGKSATKATGKREKSK